MVLNIFHCYYSKMQTAWALMPNNSPVKPRPSSVVALTLTAEILRPQSGQL